MPSTICLLQNQYQTCLQTIKMKKLLGNAGRDFTVCGLEGVDARWFVLQFVHMDRPEGKLRLDIRR